MGHDGQIFQVDLLSTVTAVASDLERPNCAGYHTWGKRRGHPRFYSFYSKGPRGHRSPQLWVPFYLCIYSLTQTTKFEVVIHVGRGLLGVSHAPPPLPRKGAGNVFPNFGVLFSLCAQPLSQNYQIQHTGMCCALRACKTRVVVSCV